MDHDPNSEHVLQELIHALGGDALLASLTAEETSEDADLVGLEVDVSLLMANDPWLGFALMQDAAGDDCYKV